MRRDGPSTPPGGGTEAWVHGLQARGRYTFTRKQAAEALGRAGAGLTKALGRLTQKRRIVSPRRGFYVIVPAEFSIPGSPPADWFIDHLMGYVGHPYYVGLLSAAAYHGAAHQQPQQFLVVAAVPMRPVRVGRVNIVFVLGPRRAHRFAGRGLGQSRHQSRGRGVPRGHPAAAPARSGIPPRRGTGDGAGTIGRAAVGQPVATSRSARRIDQPSTSVSACAPYPGNPTGPPRSGRSGCAGCAGHRPQRALSDPHRPRSSAVTTRNASARCPAST